MGFSTETMQEIDTMCEMQNLDEHDMVNHPDYYTYLSTEAITTINEVLGLEGFAHFCHGNVIKYALRAGHKGSAMDDLAKAANYAKWAAESYKKVESPQK